jgi:hypothetical protein
MARRSREAVQKRLRERRRAEKAEQKRLKRLARKQGLLEENDGEEGTEVATGELDAAPGETAEAADAAQDANEETVTPAERSEIV